VTDGPSQHLGIIELADICARIRTRNLELFVQLGGWIADTADPELQRLFTEASHRHAWHADLWAQRTPAIAPVVVDESVVTSPAAAIEPADRARAYGDALDDLTIELGALLARVDVLLDPSTARTIELVQNDLAHLRDRLHD
jgi:hypothetical protein